MSAAFGSTPQLKDGNYKAASSSFRYFTDSVKNQIPSAHEKMTEGYYSNVPIQQKAWTLIDIKFIEPITDKDVLVKPAERFEIKPGSIFSIPENGYHVY